MLPHLVCTVGALSAIIVYWMYSQRRRGPLPPGPKKLPLIGNLLDMPDHAHQWDTFMKWGKEYNSDIIHVNALGTSIVILNSYKVACDLLDKRSAIYSSRPHFTMWHKLSGWGFLFALLPYGDVWRESRRIFTKHFNPANPSINQPSEVKYVRRILGQLLQRPDDFLQHARSLVGSTILAMTYSIDTRPFDDPFIELVEKAVGASGEHIMAGGFLVDVIPILKYVPEWFPGATFQTKAAMLREHASSIRNATFEATEKLMASGDCDSSFITEGLREIEESNTPDKDLELLKDVASMAYVGGGDTTASAMGSFFLAMVCYPEVQKRAQVELDTVLKGSLPEHKDIPSLPYLSALIMELYRWQPVGPLGIPHQSTADDLYNNYHIPANSIVVANLWAMLNDESEYPEPREFKPERFLKNGQADNSVRNPMEMAFGFGRRVCPGQHLVHSTITLAAASILSTFDLLMKVDENGRKIVPKMEYKFGAIRQPLNFPCVIKPRSQYALELIRSVSGLDF